MNIFRKMSVMEEQIKQGQTVIKTQNETIRGLEEQLAKQREILENNRKESKNDIKGVERLVLCRPGVIYWPEQTKENEMEQCYVFRDEHGYVTYYLRFVGYGGAVSSESVTYYILSLTECAKKCNDKRQKDGIAWNGMEYMWRDKQCFCHKHLSSRSLNYSG